MKNKKTAITVLTITRTQFTYKGHKTLRGHHHRGHHHRGHQSDQSNSKTTFVNFYM